MHKYESTIFRLSFLRVAYTPPSHLMKLLLDIDGWIEGLTFL